MSINGYLRNLSLALWVCSFSLPANSLSLAKGEAVTIWPARVTSQSVMIGDYQGFNCLKAPPPAYTGPLQIDSKYDQGDQTKSSLKRLSRDSEQIRNKLMEYHRGLQETVTRFERAKNAEEVNYSLACLDQWLNAWANPGALLSTDASSTGKAVRKWSLAAIASGLLKVRALSDNRYELSAGQRKWLEALAGAVIADYGSRQTLDFAWFNNHDYWSAWAVSGTGMLLGRDDYLQWADTTLHLALRQITPGMAGDYAQLPQETARGSLAVEYTHYALVPLVLLVESAEVNGRPLNTAERQQLAQLANFAVIGVLNPEQLPELVRQQERPGGHKMSWLLPFLKQQPDHQRALSLLREQGDDVGSYSQIGGDIRFFYPGVE